MVTKMNWIRRAILVRLGELGYSTYRLTLLVRKDMCAATVYNFVEGHGDTSTEKATQMMDALGLKILIEK